MQSGMGMLPAAGQPLTAVLQRAFWQSGLVLDSEPQYQPELMNVRVGAAEGAEWGAGERICASCHSCRQADCMVQCRACIACGITGREVVLLARCMVPTGCVPCVL